MMNDMNQNNPSEQIQSVPTPPVQDPMITIPNEVQPVVSNSKKNNKETFILGALFVVVLAFIFFLPKTYKFITNFSIEKIKNQFTNNETKTPETPATENEKKEDEYLARVCTGTDSNGIQSTHTLYFTNKKLSKIQMNETYTLDEENTVESLDEFYNGIKDSYKSNKNVEIKVDSNAVNYTVTAAITLDKNDTTTKDLMSVKLDYNESYDSVIKKYNNKGYECK